MHVHHFLNAPLCMPVSNHSYHLYELRKGFYACFEENQTHNATDPQRECVHVFPGSLSADEYLRYPYEIATLLISVGDP